MKPLYFIFFTVVLSGACKSDSSKHQAADHTPAGVTSTSDTAQTTTPQNLPDSTVSGVSASSESESANTPPTAKTAPAVPATPKVCAPNFTKLSTIKTHHIFYVTDFLAEEFKCWVLLEEHGVQVCNGSPCVVYYVDQANIKIDPALPHHMNEAVLSTHGIGRFEYTGKFWEIKGAGQWKRKDKGYGYYNTDNQLGG